MSSENTFKLYGDEIHIYRKSWSKTALTTYREDYYDELTSVTWTKKGDYLSNTKLGMLHRYIMEKWYGKEMLSEMSKKDWIVDHMNNNGFDCRISNLAFLPRKNNVAKGQIVDASYNDIWQHIALTLCKDFSTGYYQIHIGFNDRFLLQDPHTGTTLPIAYLKLLYTCNYRIVVIDAMSIIENYKLYKKIDIKKLNCDSWKAEPFELIIPNKEESGKPVIERDGKILLCVGNNAWFLESPVEKGWVPSKNE